MTIKSIEKRIEIIEKRQPQNNGWQPPRWITLKEGERLDNIKFAAEASSEINIEEKEARDRAAGDPDWMIMVERDQREHYYRRKAKREAEAQEAREQKQ